MIDRHRSKIDEKIWEDQYICIWMYIYTIYIDEYACTMKNMFSFLNPVYTVDLLKIDQNNIFHEPCIYCKYFKDGLKGHHL